jgi:hypothetical protein
VTHRSRFRLPDPRTSLRVTAVKNVPFPNDQAIERWHRLWGRLLEEERSEETAKSADHTGADESRVLRSGLD